MRKIQKTYLKKPLVSDETLIGITESQENSQLGHVELDKHLENLYTEQSCSFAANTFAHKAFHPTVKQSFDN